MIAGVGLKAGPLNGISLFGMLLGEMPVAMLVTTFPGKLEEISLGVLVGIVPVMLPGESPGAVLEELCEPSVGVPVGVTPAVPVGDLMGILPGEQLGQPPGQLPG